MECLHRLNPPKDKGVDKEAGVGLEPRIKVENRIKTWRGQVIAHGLNSFFREDKTDKITVTQIKKCKRIIRHSWWCQLRNNDYAASLCDILDSDGNRWIRI